MVSWVMESEIRDGSGRFLPGVPGNPKGRPKENNEIKELAKQNCVEAFGVIVDIMRNALDVRLKFLAAQEVLNRAIGKPAQALSVEGHVAHFVARLPNIEERTALWMEQQSRQLSGNHNPDHNTPY
jgi:hypothetical protein